MHRQIVSDDCACFPSTRMLLKPVGFFSPPAAKMLRIPLSASPPVPQITSQDASALPDDDETIVQKRKVDRANAFKAASQKATEQTIPGSACKMLVMPLDTNGKEILWPGLESRYLVVRPAFQHNYENEFVLNKCNLRSMVTVVVCGTRGPADHAFGLYVLWRLVKAGRDVTYQNPHALHGIVLFEKPRVIPSILCKICHLASWVCQHCSSLPREAQGTDPPCPTY
jgi:hypothetical protein